MLGRLRRFVLGVPAVAINLETLILGGCCIHVNPTKLACSECPISENRGHLIATPLKLRIGERDL